MNAINRIKELTGCEKDITLYKLSQMCGLPYSTVKNAAARNGQLSIDSIEHVCDVLKIPLFEFFMCDTDLNAIEDYIAIKRRGCTVTSLHTKSRDIAEGS